MSKNIISNDLVLGSEYRESSEFKTAVEILKSRRVAVFVIVYNAQKFIESVIQRIDKSLMPMFADIFIIDDSSSDESFEVARKVREKVQTDNIHVYRTPFNRGYGGNQKLGYLYCIEKKYDIVVLLHGDGQYAPEFLPRVIAAFHDNPDAVFASRMLNKRAALDGGMPFYKWVGNQVLTSVENSLLKTRLSEFHTGYRAYNVHSLGKIPFVFNSDDFHFDTEIIIQAIANGWKINEVAIPTHYGEEECHVNGLKYAYNCVKAIFKYKLNKKGLYYSRNYDFEFHDYDTYQFKESRYSLHQFMLSHMNLDPTMVTIELGANRGLMSQHIAERVAHHTAVDFIQPDSAGKSRAQVLNLEEDFSSQFPSEYFDRCLALDLIEHLDSPEAFLQKVFTILKPHAKLYVSTANIAYLPMRISLLLGQFNYGRRGILDMTHKRLFSVINFKKMIVQYGYSIESIHGFPPPLTDMVYPGRWFGLLERFHAFLSKKMPNLFAFNFLITATRMESVEDILQKTLNADKKK